MTVRKALFWVGETLFGVRGGAWECIGHYYR